MQYPRALVETEYNLSAKALPRLPQTVAEQFAQAHRDFADFPALHCNERWWTFAEVRDAAHAAVGLLAEHGARSGDRIVLFLENSAVLRILEHGILSSGLVRVALSARLHAKEVASIAGDCAAAIVCCSPGQEAPLREALAQLGSTARILVLGDHDGVTPERLLALPRQEPSAWPPPQPTDTAMLMYSSGTTGRPKGAIVTHRAWIAQTGLALAQLPDIGPGDVVLAVAPMAHFGGSIGLNCAAVGAATVTAPSFDPEGALERVVEHGVTVLPLAPIMLKGLVDTTPVELQRSASATLRAIPYGGSPTDTATLVSSASSFPGCLVQYYGLSETLAPVASLSAADHDAAAATILSGDGDVDRARRILESAGRPSAGVELRFRADGAGVQAEDRIGEIVVRSPMVTTGYWNRPELTAAALDSDGWFITGDLGELDPDGFLHLLNRKNDLIISGGYNVYPGEVERVIESLADVEECVVVGVPHPRWGEGVHAIVVLREKSGYLGGTDSALSGLTRDVLDLCRRNLAGFKKPASLEIVAAIPRTSAGKVDRRRLVAEHLDRLAVAEEARRGEADSIDRMNGIKG